MKTSPKIHSSPTSRLRDINVGNCLTLGEIRCYDSDSIEEYPVVVKIGNKNHRVIGTDFVGDCFVITAKR